MFRKQVSLPKSFFGGHHLRVQEVLGKDEQIHIYKVNVLTCNCRGQLKTMPLGGEDAHFCGYLIGSHFTKKTVVFSGRLFNS